MNQIGQAINYRSDGVKHPSYKRDGWIFMAGALMDFGPAALADGGNFMSFAWASAPDVDPGMRWEAEQQKKCRRQAPKLASAFTKVVATGEVRSGYSAIGGGAVIEMPTEWWLTDDPLLRYRTFSVDPAEPYSERIDLPCWIWIEQASLRKASDRLYRERMGWGPLPEPPLPPPLPRTEFYDNGDGQIQTWSYAADGKLTITVAPPEPTQSRAGRPSKTTRIHKLFADHIRSNKVAERAAWEGAAISREYGGDDPPKAETCADRIRKFYNMIARDSGGNIVNGGDILEAMEYPINPDESLYSALN